MDIAQTRQRSASHSSLHHSYKAHGRHTTASSTTRPPSRRRPLRSVNENATLLRSPGPLESMLKTTTETGDIGIFSIKAGPSSSAYRQPHPPRPYPSDARLLPSQHAKSQDNKHGQEEQVLLRSYRDTTSEIISLYGSDNQQYWLRSASPTLDDGHRSYSLTTCSSRQIPSQKSSGTLQSHSSSGGGGSLQRPRSPFPYPTRLKRLGVRPASPALAENGGIDYSRMVELDRVSQRTIHGSYKPTFAHGARRPPPLSLRADANRSTASLPSRASPGPCHFGPGPGPARTPSSSLSGMSRPYERNQGSSTDQSVRSASLTSIVEMYQRPMTASSAVPALRPGGSFYYDYSEEFEKPAPLLPKTEPQVPICPIPQRAGGNSRPMVLRDDTQVHLDAVSPSIDTDGALTSQDEQQVEHPSPDEHPAHGENANESGLAMLVSKQGNSQSSPSLSEPRVTKLHVYATPSKVDDTPDLERPSSIRDAWRLSKSPGAAPDLSESLQDKRASQSSLIKLRCTLDPALSEFASLFSSFDRLTKASLPRSGEDVTISDEHCPLPLEDEEEVEDYGYPKRLGRRPSLHLFNVVAAESNAQKRRHRRNAAALRINTVGLNDSEKNRQKLSPPKEEVTILSPEPISPVRQLRVKNSIPQLMKALPPLPSEAAEEACREGGSLSEKASLSSPPNVDGAQEASPPKRKILEGIAPSPSGISGVGSHFRSSERERPDGLQQKANQGAKPRLKLKLSRTQLGRTRSGIGSKALRTNRLKQCNSLADLAVRSQRDAGADQTFARDEMQQRPRSAASDGAWASREENVDEPEPSPQLSDQFNIPYPPSPEKADGPRRPSTSTNKATLSEMHSFTSDAHSAAEHRGLRQKLSMFRLRITGGLAAETCKEAESAPAVDSKGLTANHGPEAEASGQSKGRAISTRSERMGGRMRRWASDAKQAVRSYVRRTLDRSSRLSD
ncbi:hypothetical protein HRG_005745 [Hirsutella rhossiliensis]|uniref:Uncharacterized protein n=1 Tax=Hirsutella rhossiliensis TaxID=111463 RepID=A0A9P8MXT8_9HYPO|nr:uncharacterized protein HRG_05745 [Hirsutella rhossiliensis]KAH0963235.1 hypothetical protein HRG_05745 [Hirsutella rhossiliensis]